MDDLQRQLFELRRAQSRERAISVIVVSLVAVLVMHRMEGLQSQLRRLVDEAGDAPRRFR